MSLVSRASGRICSKNSNFSIEHILNYAGVKENFHYQESGTAHNKQFDWLNCTRYKPPKLPRQKKKEKVQRRSLGRNPRIPFSSSQVAFLEAKFVRTPYLSSSDVTQLASYLKLSETKKQHLWNQHSSPFPRRNQLSSLVVTSPKQKAYYNFGELLKDEMNKIGIHLRLIEVKIWFQNRRAREKRERETKSKAEKCKTNGPNPSHLRSTIILPDSSPESLPLHTTICKYNTCSSSAAYLQIVAPLDLSDRRLICRPK